MALRAKKYTHSARARKQAHGRSAGPKPMADDMCKQRKDNQYASGRSQSHANDGKQSDIWVPSDCEVVDNISDLAAHSIQNHTGVFCSAERIHPGFLAWFPFLNFFIFVGVHPPGGDCLRHANVVITQSRSAPLGGGFLSGPWHCAVHVT